MTYNTRLSKTQGAPDPTALKILTDTYWSPKGWVSNPKPKHEDFRVAKSAGLMFDRVNWTHDKLLAALSKLTHEIKLAEVSNAFVSSLSTHRLDLRSALGSYSYALNIPKHRLPKNQRACEICGAYDREKADLNVLNFERHKWGGVRHSDPLYAWFDLREFRKLETPAARSEDVGLLRKILVAARSATPTITATQFERKLGRIFKSTKAEREVVLDIFGLCSILETKAHPGFLFGFTPHSQVEEPPYHYVERTYPVSWWRGRDGVNEKAAKRVFGWAQI